MAESMEMTVELPVYPERVYRAWLDGAEQQRMTGKAAQVENEDGGAFSALDGEVRGELISRVPHDLIRQTWQMPGMTPEGQLELRLEPTCTGAELRVTLTGIANGKTREMMQWWERVYLRPMKRYFDEIVGEYTADMGDG